MIPLNEDQSLCYRRDDKRDKYVGIVTSLCEPRSVRLKLSGRPTNDLNKFLRSKGRFNFSGDDPSVSVVRVF